MDQRDEQHLRRAIAISQSALDSGEAPFGSLLVDRHGNVLMEAHNTVLSERDVSAHPEFKIARWVGMTLSRESAQETTMFTSCQPCGMCAGAIDRAGIGRVVYALSEAQLCQLRGHAGFPSTPQHGPCMHEAAAVPLKDYYELR